MAVLTRDQVKASANKAAPMGARSNSGSGSQQTKGGGDVVTEGIDIFDPSLPEGEAVEIDITEDAWGTVSAPPMGFYRLKMFPATRKNWGSKKTAEGNWTFWIKPDSRIVSKNKDVDGAVVFPIIGTQVFRGKKISAMAAILQRIYDNDGKGRKVKSSITPLELSRIFAKKLDAEPVIWVEVDWRGQVKESEKNYRNVVANYKSWPEDENGEKIVPLTVSTQNGTATTEIYPQLNVKRWLSDAEFKELEAAGKVYSKDGIFKSKPKLQKPVEKVVDADEEDETEEVPQAKAGKVTTKAVVASIAEGKKTKQSKIAPPEDEDEEDETVNEADEDEDVDEVADEDEEE